MDTAADGENGLFLAKTNDYDLILLDLMLPKVDGITVCKRLREEKILAPIIMLTAKDAVKDKVTGLDAGAEGSAGTHEPPQEVPGAGLPGDQGAPRSGHRVLTGHQRRHQRQSRPLP